MHIHVWANGRGVGIEFADNGKGIPDRQRSLIFEKFARLDTAMGAPGAGLGLAISREVMERLGGTLTHVPSPTGTRFRVDLPGQALRAA